MRGATTAASFSFLPSRFQSTLPMRGATLFVAYFLDFVIISIHTPHAGSDLKARKPPVWRFIFQSTLPMRGATYPVWGRHDVPRDFNPHSPCGERQIDGIQLAQSILISIHTPHAGSDRFRRTYGLRFIHFNPHSPCGERRRPT